MNNNDYGLDKVVTDFMNRYQPFANGRYASYDYCYNYFLRSENLTSDIERSCLVLGFYLASWGMLRGSCFLHEKSAKHFIPTIEYISKLPKSLWKIDVDNYDSESIKEIQNVYNGIKSKLIVGRNADLTLITKVLLGVFGFVPAFDNYFCATFRDITNGKCGFRALNKDSLLVIKDFYESNKKSIDNLSKQNFTIDFITGEKTEINYTKAKIIDMYGFQVGLENQKKKKNQNA